MGEVLGGVWYCELHYDGKEAWNADPDFDSLDFGVELALRSGRYIGLTWGNVGSGFDFGMTLVEGEIAHEVMPRYEVTSRSRWSALVGQEITECRPLWREDDEYDDPVSCAPQTIDIGVEGERRVLVSACEVRADTGPHWGADHVTVFFDDAWKRRSDLTRGVHETLD